MKANLKKMLGLAALGMTLLTNTVPTWAGFVSTPEVYIGTNGNGIPFARGSMVGARYSADSRQGIGCGIVSNNNPGLSMACFAANSTTESLLCTSTDPKHVEAVQAMTASSYIYFEMDRAGLRCGVVAITDSSGLLN